MELARQRLETLQVRAKGSVDPGALTLEALEELSVALEELHVAAEELRQQNEELAATRQTVEAERQRFRDLFEFAPDGYLVTDHDGVIREANRAAAILLGVRPEYLAAKPLSVFVAAEDRAALYEGLMRFQAARESQADWHLSLQPRERAPFPASVTVGMVRDGAGRLTGLRWLIRDISERQRAEEELRSSRGQLRALAARLESVREEERTAAAQAVHDELGQGLVALRLSLAALIAQLPVDQPAWRERAREILGQTETMLKAARRIFEGLHSSLLDSLGLAAAIGAQAREFQDRTGIRYEVITGVAELPLDREQATALFRICQESLSNIARHANATHITIRLHEAAGQLLLVIEDDGRGITEQEIASSTSLGLLRTRERVLALGGELAIVGRPNGGSTVSVRVPLRKS